MKNTDPAKPIGPPAPPPAPKAGDEEAHTVELVSFGPTFTLQGATPPNPADVVLLSRRHRLRWMWALAPLALLLFVMFFGPTTYRATKAYLAASMARRAEDEIDKKHIEEAISAIRPACKMAPTEPEVMRAMAKILSALGTPGAMTYWNLLLQTKSATDEDRRAAAECAMQNTLYHEASLIIQDLLTRKGGDARNELLAAHWSAVRGTPAQTMQFATRAVNEDPTNKSAVLFLAVQELANKYLHQEGVDSLLQLADSDDATGLSALEQLSLEPDLKPDDIDRLIDRLHSHPLAGEFGRIASLVLEIKRHPEQRKTLIDQAVAAHQKAAPSDLTAFAEWLNSHNEAARVPKLVSRERALTNKDLFSAYIDALGELNRWSELKAVLTGPVLPIETPFVELYLSRCTSEMGDDQASNLHWRNAVAAAAHNPAQSLHLAVYAEEHGQDERATSIYRALTLESVTARAAYLGLLRVSSDKDTRTLCNLHDEIAMRWPTDLEMVTEDIGLNLLLNQHVQQMYQRAVDILATDPNSISHHTNVALACLRLNDPAGAHKAYSGISVDWNTAPVLDLVVYAATLHANGYTKAAHQLLVSANLRRRALRPELRDLIKSIP